MTHVAKTRLSSSNRVRLALLSAIVPLFAPLPANAATYYYKANGGTWGPASNWSSSQDLGSSGAIPGAGDIANIWSSDAASRMVSLNANTVVAGLSIGNTGTGTNSVLENVYNFTSDNILIGDFGSSAAARGLFTQVSGIDTINNSLILGIQDGSIGNYTMSGGTLRLLGTIANSTFEIGSAGAGTFTQSGSSIVNIGTAANHVSTTIGSVGNAVGRYNKSGGTFTSFGDVTVGYMANGGYNQTGGSTTINGGLTIGAVGQGAATVSIGTGTSLSVTGDTVMSSNDGEGALNINGTVTLHKLYLNRFSTVNLGPGGTLTADDASQQPYSPPNGDYRNAFTWTGGTLNIPNVSISYASENRNYGLFSGGTTINNDVTLNTQYLGVGDVDGYSANLQQNAGTFNVGTGADQTALFVDHGIYGLNNGAKLNVNGGALIQGNMNITGVASITGSMQVTGQGNLVLNGGSLSVGGTFDTDLTFIQGGGAFSVGQTFNLGPAGYNLNGGTGTIGGNLVATTTAANVNVGSGTKLTVNGDTFIGNGTSYSRLTDNGTFESPGTLNLAQAAEVDVGGTMTVGTLSLNGLFKQTGGAVTNNGATTLDGAQWNQSAGTSSLKTVNASNASAILISGSGQMTTSGPLTLGNNNNNAVLVVSGGSVTVNNALTSARSNSSITLSGGTIKANSLSLLGNLVQQGGTLNIVGKANLNGGTLSPSAGQTNIGTDLEIINSGGLLVSGTASVNVGGQAYFGGTSSGSSGSGAFGQSGGTAIFNTLTAYHGSLDLSGGTMSVSNFNLQSAASFTQSGGTLGALNINAANAQSFTFNAGLMSLVNGTFTVPASGFKAGDGTNAATFYMQKETVTGGRVTVPATTTMLADGSINNGLTLDGALLVGALTLGGSSTFDTTSTTTMTLTSATAGSRINAGSIALDGTLTLSPSYATTPVLNSTQRIITATSSTGHFATVTGNKISADHSLAVTYDATGVKVTVALGGDANLDGKVNFNDLVSLAQHYNLTGQSWSTGDFNGSGVVDFADLVVLAQNYNSTAAAGVVLPTAFAADWALAQSLVPEPGIASLVFMGGALLRRRR